MPSGMMLRDASWRLEVAVAPIVADAVDDAGGPERDPQHLHGPDREAGAPNSTTSMTPHQADAQHRVAGCRGCARSSRPACRDRNSSRLAILAGLAVQPDAAEQHALDAADLRAVRIVFGLALGVVLAVHGDPFACVTMPVVSQSQKRKKWLTIGCSVERAVRLVAMQEDRDARDRHVGEQKPRDDVAPDR